MSTCPAIHRAAIRLAAALFGVGLALAAIAADPDGDYSQRQAELDALRGRIAALKDELDREVGQRDEQHEKIEQIERQLAHLAEFDLQTHRRFRDTEKEISQLSRRRGVLEDESGVLAERLSHLARAGYMMGRQQYLKLLLQWEEPETLNRALAYYRYLARTRVDRIAELRANTRAVAALERRAGEQANELQAMQTQLERATLEIDNLHGARERQLSLLDARILDRSTEVKRLRDDEKRLSKLLAVLRDDTEQRRREEQSWDPRTNGAGFAQMKGRLAVPVRSPITAGFGQTNPDSGMRWDGIWFAAPEDESVRAVYRGVVSYADWFRGFGLLLIIDHGDGYMSLYSHNKVLHKALGDPVDTGETIADVGSTGALSRPSLYFEIREDGVPRDPLLWCKQM